MLIKESDVMKAYIYLKTKEVCLETDDFPELKDWCIYMRKPRYRTADYEVKVQDLCTLEDAIRRGPPPPPPTPCCDCPCHAKGKCCE